MTTMFYRFDPSVETQGLSAESRNRVTWSRSVGRLISGPIEKTSYQLGDVVVPDRY